MPVVTSTRPTAAPRASAPWRTLLAAGGPTNTVATNVVLVVGGLLLAASALIHLHLWSTGYKSIPTIGPLFLLQVIAGFVLALGVVLLRRLWITAVALGFVVSTLGGFLLSVSVGLFGFKDGWSAPWAGSAFAIEIAAAVMLTVGGLLCLLRPTPERRAGPPTGSPSG